MLKMYLGPTLLFRLKWHLQSKQKNGWAIMYIFLALDMMRLVRPILAPYSLTSSNQLVGF